MLHVFKFDGHSIAPSRLDWLKVLNKKGGPGLGRCHAGTGAAGGRKRLMLTLTFFLLRY
jgi:hypothetical protein